MKKTIFREYDIRGIVDRDLTPSIVCDIGRAVGTLAAERGEHSVIVGRDGRLSSPRLAEALQQGILSTGMDVVDIGAVPTPLLYYATHTLSASTSGVMITGSHNPPEYNGLKIVMEKITLHGAVIRDLQRRIETGRVRKGQGRARFATVGTDYIQKVSRALPLPKPCKVVVDCGNAIAAHTAPPLLRALGCTVVELYCTVDGHFPHHHPDPSVPENMADLQAAVRQHGADIGLAFDGDADRLGVVTNTGEIVWPDRVLMPLAEEVLHHSPGATIVYDVKCSARLTQLIERCGGKPIVWKSGHSLIKEKMRQTGALLGGEFTGHFVHADHWFGFDDAFYAAARLLNVVAQAGVSSAEFFAAYPMDISTPEQHLAMPEGAPFAFIERLQAAAPVLWPEAQYITVDGLRIEYPDGWGLVRASNTTPSLTFRFEAESAVVLERIQCDFRRALWAIQPDLVFPF